MNTVDPTANAVTVDLNEGLRLHTAGDLASAERIYRTFLQQNPQSADAWNFLGVVTHQLGRSDLAEQFLRQAIHFSPNQAHFYTNLSDVYRALNKLNEAEECCLKAIQLTPNSTAAYNNLGNVYLMREKLAEAEDCYRKAILCDSQNADAFYNLGDVLRRKKVLEEAANCFRQAAAIRPNYTLALFHLGEILSQLGRQTDAEQCFRQCIAVSPDYCAGYNSLGNVLKLQDRLVESLPCFEKAIEIRPQQPEFYYNLANSLHELGRLDEAVANYHRSLERNPSFGLAHWNLGLTLLLMGQWDQGWKEYEWRWVAAGAKPHRFTKPQWDGSPLDGKTVVLHAEQGAGDTFQFVRYVPLVKARGGRVILQIFPGLMPLLGNYPGAEKVITESDPMPEYDFHAPLITLPGLFGTTPDNVPWSGPYLSPRQDLVDEWRQKLSSIEGFRIGIAWQGRPDFARDKWRSVPLREFEPLSRIPGVRLISLQRGHGAEQIAQLRGLFTVIEMGDEFDKRFGPFMDTAGVMKNLDLLITSDTAIPHLAGTLGVPVWVATSHVPDWRWMMERSDSPWYPTMRLFRQSQRNKWDDVFQRMADELSVLVAQKKPRPVYAPTAPGELLDKISILEIKADRLTDESKLRNVRYELEQLCTLRDATLPKLPQLTELAADLRHVNEQLWDIEDHIRDCERDKDFSDRFVQLARSVYMTNDRRAELKRRVNEVLGSRIMEEKSYAKY